MGPLAIHGSTDQADPRLGPLARTDEQPQALKGSDQTDSQGSEGSLNGAADSVLMRDELLALADRYRSDWRERQAKRIEWTA